MANRLLALPNELLHQIMYQLDSDIEPDDPASAQRRRLQPLLACSLASKELRAVVKPFLYRVYFSSHKTSVDPFLRLLCEEPHIASHVQILRLKGSAMEKLPPSASTLGLFRKAMEPLQDWALHDVLLHALAKGCHTAKVILILLLSTRVQRLFLDPIAHSSCGCPQLAECLESILSRSFDAKHKVYSRLQEVVLKPPHSYSDGDQGADHDTNGLVSQLMRLPSLKRMFAEGLVPPSKPLPTSSSISNVSDLTLRGPQLANYVSSPTHLIQACKSLKQLEITDYGAAPLLNVLLQQHSSSLETLYLPYIRDATFNICNLHTFERLQELTINGSLFCGSTEHHDQRTLPTSLKRLAIHADYGLDDLLATIEGGLPLLGPNVEVLAIDCAIKDEANDKYLDLIQEAHPGNVRLMDKDVSPKAGTGWIVFLSEFGNGMNFRCLKGEQTICDTVTAVVKEVGAKGMSALLEDYYEDWPQHEEKYFALCDIRARARASYDTWWDL